MRSKVRVMKHGSEYGESYRVLICPECYSDDTEVVEKCEIKSDRILYSRTAIEEVARCKKCGCEYSYAIRDAKIKVHTSVKLLALAVVLTVIYALAVIFFGFNLITGLMLVPLSCIDAVILSLLLSDGFSW